jgi:hypothetical protein
MSAIKITGRLLLVVVLLIGNFVAWSHFGELTSAADSMKNTIGVIILVGILLVDVYAALTIYKKWIKPLLEENVKE